MALVIQRATERALAAGATASSVLDLVKRRRSAIEAPIVLFTYANPVLRMGVDTFGDRARDAGVDGSARTRPADRRSRRVPRPMAKRDIDMIFPLSPTTTDARLSEAGEAGTRVFVWNFAVGCHRHT